MIRASIIIVVGVLVIWEIHGLGSTSVQFQLFNESFYPGAEVLPYDKIMMKFICLIKVHISNMLWHRLHITRHIWNIRSLWFWSWSFWMTISGGLCHCCSIHQVWVEDWTLTSFAVVDSDAWDIWTFVATNKLSYASLYTIGSLYWCWILRTDTLLSTLIPCTFWTDSSLWLSLFASLSLIFRALWDTSSIREVAPLGCMLWLILLLLLWLLYILWV